jgi:hypothetical protein
MRKYANKIEETNVYGIFFIPKLDSLSNPIYRIPFYMELDSISSSMQHIVINCILYLDLIPIGFGLVRFE